MSEIRPIRVETACILHHPRVSPLVVFLLEISSISSPITEPSFIVFLSWFQTSWFSVTTAKEKGV